MLPQVPASFQEVDQFLMRQFPRAEGVLSFARGSAGLYSLFSALVERHGVGEVIIPGICCEVVALAALYAGLRPVIADVDPDTLCMSPAALKPLIGTSVRAVVVVHAFGCVAPVEEIARLCAGRDIVLIEDMAHAAGAVDDTGYKLGEGGDCSLYSFSEGKIVKGEGGALVVNRDHALFERVRAVRELLPPPMAPTTYKLLELSLRNLTHALHDLSRAKPDTMIAPLFRAAAESYRDLIVVGADDLPLTRIADSFANLVTTNRERMRRYRLYERGIRRAGTRVARIPMTGTCWRCPVLFPCQAEALAVTQALRTSGIHASNHYFPLDKLLDDVTAQGNQRVGTTIVDLWVDESTTDAAIYAAIDVINHYPLQHS